MSDDAVGLLGFLLWLWAAWYLWRSLKSGIAPEPAFLIRRDESPMLYWTFTGIFFVIWVLTAVALAALFGNEIIA